MELVFQYHAGYLPRRQEYEAAHSGARKETLLNAEKLSSLAVFCMGGRIREEDWSVAWKGYCLDHFHDIHAENLGHRLSRRQTGIWRTCGALGGR